MLASESKERYLAAFKQSRAHATALAWLRELRESGIASFAALGFPTTRNEDWKYTNVDPIATQTFVHANGEAKTVSAGEIVARSMIEADAPRLVFVNGIFASEFSQVAGLPQGLMVKSLGEFFRQDDNALTSQLEIGRASCRERV